MLLLIAYALALIVALIPAPLLLIARPLLWLGLGGLSLVIAALIIWILVAWCWSLTIGRPMPALAFAISLLALNTLDIMARRHRPEPSASVGAQMLAILIIGLSTFFGADAGWVR